MRLLRWCKIKVKVSFEAHQPCLTSTNAILGPYALWILDFDCCKRLPMSVEGVGLAAQLFWRNDAYYPKPKPRCEKDRALWEIFKDRFLETSRAIMASKDEAIRQLQLPEKLIARIVETIGLYSKAPDRCN